MHLVLARFQFPSQACQVQLLKSCACQYPGTIHAGDADVLGAALSIRILIWGSGLFFAKIWDLAAMPFLHPRTLQHTDMF